MGCSSSKFTIDKIPINEKKIRTDGLYYSIDNTTNKVEFCFLYENGIFFSEGSYYENIDIGLLKLKKEIYEKTLLKYYANAKPFWGLYRLIGDSIVLEKPEPTHGYPTLRHTGRVLNDTTFYINTAKEDYQKPKIFENSIYHFKKFEPKPDSTNKFVN
jgi:hypothetical protein